MQSLCLLNTERAKSIPKSNLTEVDKGVFDIATKDDKLWRIVVPDETSTCPAFLTTRISCKHFFAIFYHYPKWSWNDLPKTLTDSTHMILDNVNEPSIDIRMDLHDVTDVYRVIIKSYHHNKKPQQHIPTSFKSRLKTP